MLKYFRKWKKSNKHDINELKVIVKWLNTLINWN